MIGARAAEPFPARPYADLAAVRAAAAAGRLRFALLVAPMLGRFAPVAEIVAGEELSDDEHAALDLDPTHTGGGIEPVPFLLGLRRAAYAASRARRPLPDSDG
jgi:hypothetical protein